MRDLSTLAKLLAEEDINVVHRQQETAAFDVKNRELSLPIWKEMSKDVQDLMTVHEVGHALWTPLEMLEKARKENIEFSFVNVLEDVRIEKKVQNKYLGSIRVFSRGYKELIGNNFFGTNDKNVSKMNLIDRINLHYKHFPDIYFSDSEMVWVEKANQTVTPDDVLELAKELYEYIQNNPQSQGQNPAEESLEDHMNAMVGPSEQSGQEENSDDSDQDMDGSANSNQSDDDNSEEKTDSSEGSGNEDGESSEDNSAETSNSSGDETSEETENASSNSDKSDETSDDTSESKDTTSENMGKGSVGGGGHITATTDSTSKESFKSLLDTTAKDRLYGFVPKIDLNKAIIDYKTIINMYNKQLNLNIKNFGNNYPNKVLADLDKFTKENKKTVAYMVKEFEMKKAADQYARSSTSKTGSLDMGSLHTYKFNDDLFKKVTTLPGATNHALVLFLDWSGSMARNLQGTLNQLYNLIWFCKRTQIPFEVFAFTDHWNTKEDVKNNKITSFKSGDLIIEGCNLLQFFSSKMNNNDIVKMMGHLNMYASQWDYNQRTYWPTVKCLDLGGTPLGQAAACALEFVPMYKKQTGVQKINTVFLTDGAGCRLEKVYSVLENHRGQTYNGYEYAHWDRNLMLTDKTTNTTICSSDFNSDTTAMLLELLRKRVPDMNIVNFFVAGTGRAGKVCKHAVRNLVSGGKNRIHDWWETTQLTKEAVKKINKENVGIFENRDGFDQVYILPGLKSEMEDENLDVDVGASKAQLKKAFGKMANGKTTNRPLLNNFVKMVA